MPKRPATSMIEEEFGDPKPVSPLPQAEPTLAEPAPTDTTPRKRAVKPQE